MSDSLTGCPIVIYIVARSGAEVNGEVYRNAPLENCEVTVCPMVDTVGEWCYNIRGVLPQILGGALLPLCKSPVKNR